ncbi:hypothetical protein JCGZ_26609 [Jatropha curcas]|uniref:Aminotransferase-like plant mobile domain-containing protein n=1 Tax=Jatropha curcas TaxID=180498 RepID=A0A067JWJ4_JATCU|nr:hypothetical protein JCGZ_26609 [Jatropha curcas]
MSQISEIPASTYTPEMETLRALPDISTFDGEPVPVSQNPLTPGTRPVQLLPLPGTEFPLFLTPWDCEAWSTYSGREVTELHTRSRLLMREYWADRYFLGERDRSMAYFPDRISRQYGMIQRVPRIHNFESGLTTPHLLTNLANRWRNRNTRYLDEGTMQDTVTPAYVNWFFTP